jgi:rsbT co-antagonist protein RsbR
VAARQPTASLALIKALTSERDLLADEVALLQEREQQCQAQLHDLQQQWRSIDWPQLRVFAKLIEGVADGIVITTIDGMITYANAAFQALTGYGPRAIGMYLSDMIVPEERQFVPAVIQRLLQAGVWQGTRTYLRCDGQTFEANISLVLIRDEEGQPSARAAIIRDLTRQRRLEQEQLLLQEQVIAAQQSQLRDLRAPVLRLSAGVIMVPISGSVDDARADDIVDTVLGTLAQQSATTAIVDISAQTEIDGPLARLLLRAGRALKLIGTTMVVTGAGSSVVDALQVLGLAQLGVPFHATLQEGIDVVLFQFPPRRSS